MPIKSRKLTQDNLDQIGRRQTPRFALIIGIDGYTGCQKLRGAVADAKAMEQYLKDVLQVPYIDTLYNEQANRKAIIDALQKLPKDTRIDKGDPIVIFFAGHGKEHRPPAEWRLRNKIQSILPQDFKTDGNEPVPGHAPIPDRTIGVLLEDIAKKKGDNITVIFDCCHSASGTRAPPEGYTPRTIEPRIIIPESLDDNIWRGRAGLFHEGFAYYGLRSHILLAACGEAERAYESEGRGQFTKALLEILQNSSVNDVTYTEILERIHLDKQSPHCEGVNRHRVLFGTIVPAGRHVWYPVKVTGPGTYEIGGGLAHGVARGLEFTLYDERRRRLDTVLVDDASQINDFETTVTLSGHIESVAHAKVTRVGKVPIYLGDHSELEEVLEGMNKEDSVTANFRVVGDIGEAKLQAAIDYDTAAFTTLDKRVQDLGLTELPHKANLSNLPRVLGAEAHFFWYLEYKNNIPLDSMISVDFHYLNKVYDDDGTPLFVPDEQPPCQKDPNTGALSIIDFVVDPLGRYGIEIKSQIPRDLYLNAFLFNNSSLSVVPCYTPPTAVSGGTLDPPLKAKGTFTIGYGTGGMAPLSFAFEENQDIDVGYLKIFFSTLPIDLCDIEQMSPFTDVHPPPIADRRQAIIPELPRTHARHIWFTFTIPVVQRRRK